MVLHDSMEERAQLIAALIKGGIDHEERCVHEGEVDLKERIMHNLGRLGIDGQLAEAEGTLHFIKGFEDRMQSERDVIHLVEEIEAMARSARSDGYKGLRLIGGLRSDASIRGHTREYLEYESRISAALDHMHATVACLYAIRDFYPGLLSWVMKEHSLVVVNGRACDNLFHTAAESAIKPTSSKKELDRMLGLILSAEMQKQDLIAQSEELRQLNEALSKEVERRRSFELALLESQGNMRSVIDSMADAMFVVDHERRVLLVNQAFEEFARGFGVDGPFLDEPLASSIPFAAQYRDRIDEAFHKGRMVIHEAATRYEGRPLHAEMRFIPVQRGSGIGQVLVVTRDITDRRMREIGEEERGRQLRDAVEERTRERDQERQVRLQESAQRLELERKGFALNEMLDRADSIVVAHDNDGGICYMNQAGLDFFGLAQADLQGLNVADLVSGDDAVKVPGILAEIKANGNAAFRISALAKGSIPVQIEAKVISIGQNGDGLLIGTVRRIS
jgi:PAS domain S-box-containing protein